MATSLQTHCGSAQKSITILTDSPRSCCCYSHSDRYYISFIAIAIYLYAKLNVQQTIRWAQGASISVNQSVIDFVWAAPKSNSFGTERNLWKDILDIIIQIIWLSKYFKNGSNDKPHKYPTKCLKVCNNIFWVRNTQHTFRHLFIFF